MIDEAPIRERYSAVGSRLDERGRRLSVAAEAKTAGRGGIAAASRATKVARSTIGRGRKDLEDPASLSGKVRRKGGGRPTLTAKSPDILNDLKDLLEAATMGDPMRPLLWVSKSHAKLATALRAKGHKVSSSSMPKLLTELGYSRQSNRKTKEGSNHPDRDAQFEHINAAVLSFQASDEPVISVDTKKKELVGEFKNGGSDYCPKGQPIEVNTHDFADKELGKVVPYGIYDVGANLGYVSLGIDHDTGEFAVNGIRLWLDRMGRERYPAMTKLLITRRLPRRRPGAVAPMAHGCGCGSSPFRNSPTKPASPCKSVTIRLEPRSGTRSNIACSATSPKTGEAPLSPAGSPSSI